MQITHRKISPHMARDMLETSGGNRPIKQAKVAAYARDMAAGNWDDNGETIIFDINGALVNGHHRLLACVKADAPFRTLIVEGVSPDARKTIDTGASRTVADTLGFHGYQNTAQISAIVRVLMSLHVGRPRSANPSAHEVFDFIERYPSVAASASYAASHKRGIRHMATMIGAIHFIANLTGDDDEIQCAEDFTTVFQTGVPAYNGCPAHLLWKRILKADAAGKSITTRDVQLLAAVAWQKFRLHETAKILKIPDKFVIKGWTDA